MFVCFLQSDRYRIVVNSYYKQLRTYIEDIHKRLRAFYIFYEKEQKGQTSQKSYIY